VREGESGLTSLIPELEELAFSLYSWLTELLTERQKLVNLGHLHQRSRWHPFVQPLPVTFSLPQAWTLVGLERRTRLHFFTELPILVKSGLLLS